jgi:hypothetical protein
VKGLHRFDISLSPATDSGGLSSVVPESLSEHAAICTNATRALRVWIKARCFLNGIQVRPVPIGNAFRFVAHKSRGFFCRAIAFRKTRRHRFRNPLIGSRRAPSLKRLLKASGAAGGRHLPTYTVQGALCAVSSTTRTKVVSESANAPYPGVTAGDLLGGS